MQTNRWFTLWMMLLTVHTALTQSYFPVKVNNQWGLIHADGSMFIEPRYDAIGEFKQYGYAVIQRNGGVGLLNQNGEEIVSPNYEDLKVLDSLLVAVMDTQEWMVRHLNGTVILPKGYEKVHILSKEYLAYRQHGLWGIVRADNGKNIAPPQYDAVRLVDEHYFETQKEERKGLVAASGTVLLPPTYEEVKIFGDELFFFQLNKKWGAVNAIGEEVIAPQFKSYQPIGQYFLKLNNKKGASLYSIVNQDIITNTPYDNFYSFSEDKILTKKNRLLGLLYFNGEILLPPEYHEIHQYAADRFRVNVAGKWGIVAAGGTVIVPFRYDYIAPLDDAVCLVKADGKFGLVNIAGEEVLAPEFHRIEIKDNQAKAYQGQTLSMFYFDENGTLKDKNAFEKHFTIRIGNTTTTPTLRRNGWNIDGQDNFRLENFEWFYAQRTDKWGLRRIDNGEIQIQPIYDWIQIERDLGFTIVGIEKMGYQTLDRTEFRFEMAYGLVNNEVGMLTTLVNIWDIRMSDFEKGYPVARCIFENGRHGLISNIGKVIVKDYAYIGEFHNGRARMSIKGKLSGSLKEKAYGIQPVSEYHAQCMAPNRMIDYTQFDRTFRESAQLTCQKCVWGYLDTLGKISVEPQFDFARNFVNKVGIVAFDNKWGAVGVDARQLIPCQYDDVHFLENTNNQILHLSVNRQKYGLIDSLGQVTVSSTYDEIGAFCENRLAVMRDGRWGFVNQNGVEIIPCIYHKVEKFSEGYATVKKGRKWGIINKNGDVVIDFEHNHLGNVANGLFWFQNIAGKGYQNIRQAVIIPAEFQRTHDFENGIARVMQNGKWGLIDTLGQYVLRPKYADITPFDKNGLAIVRHHNKVRYGVIDRNGKELTNKAYQRISPFQEDMAVVWYKGNYGFINTECELVVPAIYSKVSDFSEGYAAVQYEGNCGYINKQGEAICPFEYSKCLDFKEGKAIVYKGLRNAGLIDTIGKTIIEPSLNRLVDFQDGRGLVRENSQRFYYITEQARHYKGSYDQASGFQNGVAVVQIDGKWGVINQKGIEIVPPKYDKIEAFEDGYAKVRIASLNGISNLQGELIVHPDYEYISYAGEGLFRVEQGDKIGYFDMEGNWVWGLQK